MYQISGQSRDIEVAQSFDVATPNVLFIITMPYSATSQMAVSINHRLMLEVIDGTNLTTYAVNLVD